MSSLLLNQKWNIASADCGLVRGLVREAGIPEGIASFLVLRGISEPDAALDHLSPRLALLSDPFLMRDMGRAVERLGVAISQGEKIGIFGDYDADGVTATALLHLFFREIGCTTEAYLPHREHDGYGLNRSGIDILASSGCTLIVTVDCGITSRSEVNYARESGIDVIVTDHHEPGTDLPEAVAVIDPKRPDCIFPFKELSGVGVAFCLIRALRTWLHKRGFFSAELPPPNLKKYLDLVALGTVSDVVPLLGENRILVHFGLFEASAGARPGFKALKRVAAVDGAVTSAHLAFRLGPRINAAGRMAHADKAFRLLTTESEREAMILASELDSLNSDRQAEERLILREATKMIEEMGELNAYVLSSKNWRRGVVGIVASRIMEKVSRPVILLAEDGDEAVGSGRAPVGLDLYRLLYECRHWLHRFGGHKAAAGMKLSVNDISSFHKELDSVTSSRISSLDVVPSLKLDARISQDQLANPAFADMCEQLEPFGAGYPPPLFALHGFAVRDVRTMGRGHLKVILDASGSAASQLRRTHSVSGIEIVGWGHGDKADLPWEQLEVAFEPGINVWNGRRVLQLRLMDARMPKD